MAKFLLEIGVEEMPAGYIKPALAALEKAFGEAIKEARLKADEVFTTGTPRRLVLSADGIPEGQGDLADIVTGPPAKVARDADGNWTKAGLGFARSQGAEPDALFLAETPKGQYAALKTFHEGRAAGEILAEALPRAILKIRFPKSMRWTPERTAFARPIRRIVALLDQTVVNFNVAGVESGRATCGHPFLAPQAITLQTADYAAYRQALLEAYVIVDMSERRRMISDAIQGIAQKNNWVISDGALIDEVTNLVEYPGLLVGSFEKRFLEIPGEVLVASMKSHQRYFPVRDADTGRLQASFVAISNRTDNEAPGVCRGNERVLTARLDDAAFFWAADRKKKLADRIDKLAHVVYHEKLGSYLEKAQRMEQLAGRLADMIGLDSRVREQARRAALLSKADLVTEMVGEFPSLEGAMGRLYAEADGEAPEVAKAIGEHYRPRAAGDPAPASPTGVVVALSDKLDALAGCFRAGLAPTGSVDPYALRRRAQGVVRIMLEREVSLELDGALDAALEPFEADPAARQALREGILEFLRDRFYHMMVEKGFKFDLVRAVLALPSNDLGKTKRRLDAVTALAAREDWPRLVTVVERAHNITREVTPAPVNEALLAEQAEKALYAHWTKIRPEAAACVEREDYVGASILFSGPLAELLHEFFDKVFVNVDDQALRQNRLALLADIRDLYETNIAVLSDIQTNDAARGIPGK